MGQFDQNNGDGYRCGNENECSDQKYNNLLPGWFFHITKNKWYDNKRKDNSLNAINPGWGNIIFIDKKIKQPETLSGLGAATFY